MTARPARRGTRRRVAAALVVACAAFAGCAGPPPAHRGPNATELRRVTPPPGPVTIAALVRGTPELSTLAAALARSGLEARLDEPFGEYTLFAPTDAAFGVRSEAFVASLEGEGGRARAAAFIASSMLDGVADDVGLRRALRRGGGRWNLSNARGTTLGLLSVPAASDSEGPVTSPGGEGVVDRDVLVDDDIGGTGTASPADAPAPDGAASGLADVVVELVGGGSARVVRPDLRAVNGVVHVIDAVLSPSVTGQR